MTDTAPIRAFGRSLADFGDLLPAEALLLDACRRGRTLTIGQTLPKRNFKAKRVRAGFVRFLALGGDVAAPLHEAGVMLSGAWIDGLLDFDFCNLPSPLHLHNCRLQQLDAADAHMPRLSLTGCHIDAGINADGLHVTGDVYLDVGFTVNMKVRLLGAVIGGDLACTGGTFRGSDGEALCFDRAQIAGGVFLHNGFNAKGAVRLPGANIVGNLECSGGLFECTKGKALSFDRATINGSAFLDDGFTSDGTVDFAGTKIMALIDSEDCWPQAGKLLLDGIRIGQFTGAAPTSGDARVRWLMLQWPEHLKEEFKPQPWEETIRVLREMGHDEDARIVAIAKQEQLRIAGKFRGVGRLLHITYGWLVGYGHRPMRLFGRVGGAWVLLTLAFWAAANPSAFGSTTHLIAPTRAGTDATCPAGPGKATCETLPPDYRSFFAPAYAADLLVPVINLGYKTQWQPRVSVDGKPLYWGHALRVLAWAGILFGWVASLLLVGVLTNLIKKD